MAKDHLHLQQEEEYIEMEFNCPTTLKCYNLPCSSPPHSIEFEFQKSSKTLERPNQTTSSPADELFYKGNLLPLHLPPRLQMVEKLLKLPENLEKPTANTAPSTPFESCNISPATSCYVSGELNPEEEEYEYDYSFFELEPHSNNNNNNKKLPWSKKLNLIKKLKASKNYLKSLFSKSSGSPNERKNEDQEQCGAHRRSFSKAVKRCRCSNKSYSNSNSSSCNSSDCSSFSCVVNSNDGVLKRSSSVNSEKECSVQGAIAYCNKSQERACGRKSVSDAGFCLVSEARIGVENEN